LEWRKIKVWELREIGLFPGMCPTSDPQRVPLMDRTPFFSSEYGTYKTGNARFWPWLSGKRPKPFEVAHSSLESGALEPKLGCARGCRVPHGGVRPFHQTSTWLTQSTLGPYGAQIWSRNPPNLAGSKPAKSTVRAGHPSIRPHPRMDAIRMHASRRRNQIYYAMPKPPN